jgi:hypothetical protein
MITPMRRRIAAVLVILGWVSLSCFDVVEDLDEIRGQVAVSSSSPGSSSTAKRGGWGPLANNIVESANRIPQTNVTIFRVTPTILDFVPVLDFRGHSQLHKLSRVFLI